MQKSLAEKDTTIKQLEANKRNMIEDAVQRKVMDGMILEISQLKEMIKMLEQRLNMQELSEGHGYF